MAELLLHGRPVPTVFDLLGRNENDMTYALSWGLARSARFLGAVIRAVTGADADTGRKRNREREMGTGKFGAPRRDEMRYPGGNHQQ